MNEDFSHQSGSHWVGMLLNLKRNEAQFFDSYGEKPLPQVTNWIKDLNKKLSNKNKVQIIWNDKRHQFANSECGVYTIHFIVRSILGTPFKKIVNDIIKDEKMNQKRKEFFNPYNKKDNKKP